MDEKETKEISEKTAKEAENHSGHVLKVVLIVLVCFIVLAGIAGLAKVAFFDRNFSGRFAIGRNVEVEGPAFGGMMRGGMYREGFGANFGGGIIGTLSAISGDNLTVHKASTNKDYAVVISDSTQIRKNGDIAAKSDLAVGQALTISGASNSSGQIEATYIIIN